MTYGRALTLLADPTRRQLLERLAEHPQSVTDLAQGLSVSRPAVSQHLKSMLEANLVSVRQEGTRNIYSARAEALGELRAYVELLWRDVLNQYAKGEEDER
jgi:DNA-binding transcriptional ArsR family regulator